MFKIPYLPALLCLVAITAFSVGPGVPMPKMDVITPDKIGHAAAYALLAWLVFQGFKAAKGRTANRKEALVIFCLTAGYGVFMEFVQGAFFPNRYFEVYDMLANALGAGAAAWYFGD